MASRQFSVYEYFRVCVSQNKSGLNFTQVSVTPLVELKANCTIFRRKAPVLTSLHFLLNLRMYPVSYVPGEDLQPCVI